ncbi:MAG: hypothetical protein A3F54_03585 [Candidatus Kerfeldbacteria bacterium RIFCSPHIGHO2_12_FULL_48_17]|uniref:Growth inhibitor n=1 Tax=Candidatus Kerfeldbacteria bacterium RIFCSPHIGHO2_12_FULL_48_17 TaxID=1798542 RepID=A0A1G2AZW3_9BACT|nr:MAG: hypothetical protein A3F54_03585 [Candidatus Kerfeldbacteria bacterium RIFCSPHIGHO2_12_FULL_48_17]
MKQYNFGDIVLTAYPLVTGSEGKQRPALVLHDLGDDDLLLARITSKNHYKSSYDITVKEWKAAGLLFPSVIRIHKVTTLEKAIMIRTMGKLEKLDQEEVKKAVKNLWNSI